ncbi:hypothetical protein ANME2D_02857 [Candidatus Methanoperedens nitroreducens]|uniref:Uncharacterized protein n=1 Tax=Candidatus Methanoperedens nitratireducens TaxID=1392998 RepID=A0A062V0B9_9EURY|nr:hypothetical protein [Candidatus Methanoperedens nitroreducens]KCZ70832.1 hypothetical protein ANME2D_02857 [Candidatus Methanoperedens nitroreducens]MDJ1420687.1 hypothetical protein [Candidatus Methanoperedens sp.]
MIQIVLTPAAGKRLIAKAIATLPAIQAALQSGTIVIVAGTTNGYVAEEILALIDQSNGFNRKRFFRGITLPPSKPTTETGRLPDEMGFPGDVVIVKGKWQQGKTIFDVVDDLKQGDVILKGANAIDISQRRAAILIGHPKGGTIAVALQAVIGRRVHLILPVGLEKRISGNLDEIALRLNAPEASGPRLLPVPGEIFTEIEAITLLSGATAELVAGGGVSGAEGSIWLAISGGTSKETSIKEIIASLLNEPSFELI